MFRWLWYLVIALGMARLVRSLQAGPAWRGMPDFHPGGGSPHPSVPDDGEESAAFPADDVVDGEFEEIPARRRP
jgi:hypothetical protein